VTHSVRVPGGSGTECDARERRSPGRLEAWRITDPKAAGCESAHGRLGHRLCDEGACCRSKRWRRSVIGSRCDLERERSVAAVAAASGEPAAARVRPLVVGRRCASAAKARGPTLERNATVGLHAKDGRERERARGDEPAQEEHDEPAARVGHARRLALGGRAFEGDSATPPFVVHGIRFGRRRRRSRQVCTKPLTGERGGPVQRRVPGVAMWMTSVPPLARWHRERLCSCASVEIRSRILRRPRRFFAVLGLEDAATLGFLPRLPIRQRRRRCSSDGRPAEIRAARTPLLDRAW